MPAAIEVNQISKRFRIGAMRAGGGSQSMLGAAAGLARRAMKTITNPTSSSTGMTDELWALRDINFSVQPGERVGLIGKNGAGKSTLLKIMSRITPPTEGEILLRGRVRSLLEVGTGFHPELTGRENIYLNGALLGMPTREIDAKFDEIVDFSGVERFLETPVKHYSSGMYVRLAFAVAAHLDCEILLVDEVLAVGDVEFQQKCLGKMQEITGEGRTVLFVSHNISALQRFCERGVVLRDGGVAFDGPLDEALEDYLWQGRSAQGAEVDLREHAGRRVGSLPMLNHLRIRSKDRTTSQILMGDPVEFHVKVTGHEPLSWSQFAVVIENQYGEILSTISSRYYGPEFLSDCDAMRATLVCQLESLPLVPGHYPVSVYLRQKSCADAVLRAAMLEILPSAQHASAQVPSQEKGVMIVPAQFHYETV